MTESPLLRLLLNYLLFFIHYILYRIISIFLLAVMLCFGRMDINVLWFQNKGSLELWYLLIVILNSFKMICFFYQSVL